MFWLVQTEATSQSAFVASSSVLMRCCVCVNKSIINTLEKLKHENMLRFVQEDSPENCSFWGLLLYSSFAFCLRSVFVQIECPDFPEDLKHWISFISASSQALRAESGLEDKNKWSHTHDTTYHECRPISYHCAHTHTHIYKVYIHAHKQLNIVESFSWLPRFHSLLFWFSPTCCVFLYDVKYLGQPKTWKLSNDLKCTLRIGSILKDVHLEKKLYGTVALSLQLYSVVDCD